MMARHEHGQLCEANVVADANAHSEGVGGGIVDVECGHVRTRRQSLALLETDAARHVHVKQVQLAVRGNHRAGRIAHHARVVQSLGGTAGRALGDRAANEPHAVLACPAPHGECGGTFGNGLCIFREEARAVGAVPAFAQHH